MDATFSVKPTIALRAEIEQLQQELAAVRARAQEAEHRAALARKSAADAWGFVRALRGVPRPSP